MSKFVVYDDAFNTMMMWRRESNFLAQFIGKVPKACATVANLMLVHMKHRAVIVT